MSEEYSDYYVTGNIIEPCQCAHCITGGAVEITATCRYYRKGD